jgi:hypothetical protein
MVNTLPENSPNIRLRVNPKRMPTIMGMVMSIKILNKLKKLNCFFTTS